MSELQIRAEHLHKTYLLRKKPVDVLRGACLEVRRGETVAVIGLSGAGKSTLLHVLGGLDRPDSGRVLLGDADLYALSSAKRTRIRARRIGFVFQSYHLLPEMDVTENIMLPGMTAAHPFTNARALRLRARELLDAVGLGARADHTPLELSGGEQQRVALARALMNDPEIVLADEPTGNLDAETGGQVLDYLFELTRAKGHTLIMVTHNEAIARSCDRILRLEGGLIRNRPPSGAA